MNPSHSATLVRTYFERLTAADYPAIIAMFEADGWVESPYLGKLPASEFFARLGNASSRNILTVHDILLGENGDSVAAGKRCASTTNRNFRGRQGRGARTHLMSPAMVAAAAVTGRLTDVRPLL